MLSIDYISTWLLGITCLFSISAFNNRQLLSNLMFNAFLIRKNKEYYRFISSGFIHANWMHLIFNMIVLFYFGFAVESYFMQLFEGSLTGKIAFGLMYISGMIAADITSYNKHKNNIYYNSLGASGATSAVLFSFILFQPWNMLLIFGIIPIPAIIFGVLYIWYSNKMSKESGDNINHEAHLYGAIYGILYTIVLQPKVILIFINQLLAF